MAEEYCWVITQTAGCSCCGRSGSSVLGFGFQLDTLLHTYVRKYVRTFSSEWGRIWLVPELLGQNICARRAASAHNAVTSKTKSRVAS